MDQTQHEVKGEAVTADVEKPVEWTTIVSVRLKQQLWLFVTLFLILPTLLSIVARFHWSLDLLTSFHLQYALGLTPFAIFCIGKRHWWQGVILVLVLCYNLALVLPVYLPQANSAEGGQSLRLLVTNVWTSNREHSRLIELIHQEAPDVVLALEVNDVWIAALQELSDEYPYVKSFVRSDNFGIALFSKTPFQHAEILKLGDRQLPTVYAKLALNNVTTVTILGTHPLPPAGRAAAYRNQQLSEVANFAAEQTGHVILCGDLNLTPWSPHWDSLLSRGKLRDSRQGFGIQPSWPTGNPMLQIPIDHVLVSDEIAVHNRKIGPNVGSDHFPVIADLRFPPE